MPNFVRREYAGLIRNLRGGIRLIFFRKTGAKDFRVSYDQAVLLVLFSLLVSLCVGYIKQLPNPAFNRYALFGTTLVLFGVLLATYFIAKSLRDDRVALKLVVFVYSISPLFYLIWSVMESGKNHWYRGNYTASWTIYGIYLAWALAVLAFIIYRMSKKAKLRALLHFAIYVTAAIVPAYFFTGGEFWYQQPDSRRNAAAYRNINSEDVYYRQPHRIDAVKAKLLRGRKGVTDLYFVGFAGYADQDVFMKEVQFAQALFDRRFDTRGRSVALINNAKTVSDTPIASATNLAMVFKHLGRIMNPEEDILFLLLTSHGSENHELSVNFWPLRLNAVTPLYLKKALDEAGIKSRVLMISACYSGGFIESLKNDDTLIATAAAANKQSFGCGNENEFTYFGEAVLNRELQTGLSFPAAFENAAAAIGRRESQEKLSASEPQLVVGKNIQKRLGRLERRLQGAAPSKLAEYQTNN